MRIHPNPKFRYSLVAGGLLCLAIAAGSVGVQAADRAGRAPTCEVPSNTPTIQAGLDDPACNAVVVAPGIYTEAIIAEPSLNKLLRSSDPGNPATIRGQFDVRGSNLVELADIQIEFVDLAEQPLFADGFETGDTTQWSSTSP